MARGTELLAVRATLTNQQGYSGLTFDPRNTLNRRMKHFTILTALADLIPPTSYALNPYSEWPQNLSRLALVTPNLSTRPEGYSRCDLRPLCYSTRSMQLLSDFRADPPVINAKISSSSWSPEHAKNTAAVEAITALLQTRM